MAQLVHGAWGCRCGCCACDTVTNHSFPPATTVPACSAARACMRRVKGWVYKQSMVSSLASSSFSSFDGFGRSGSRKFASFNATAVITAVSNWFSVTSNKSELHEIFQERISIFLNFLNIQYLTMLRYCLQAFVCTDIAGVKYMQFQPDTQCYTTAVRRWCCRCLQCRWVAGWDLTGACGVWALPVIHCMRLPNDCGRLDEAGL